MRRLQDKVVVGEQRTLMEVKNDDDMLTISDIFQTFKIFFVDDQTSLDVRKYPVPRNIFRDCPNEPNGFQNDRQ
jgi:hypothetical protein